MVLSVDEKSQIQALDRTQPGLAMKPDRAGTMTHDYKRNGTITLFAALNVLDGTIIGRNMQRHRHQEFIQFLNAIEAQVPARKEIHAIVDNYATHMHPKVRMRAPACRRCLTSWTRPAFITFFWFDGACASQPSSTTPECASSACFR